MIQQADRKIQVLVVTQPGYPVPAVNDGAQAIVIEDTVERLMSLPVTTLSLWQPKLAGTIWRNDRYRFVYTESLMVKFLRRILRVLFRSQFSGLPLTYQDFLVGLKLEMMRRDFGVTVVHTTKMNWLLAVKRACNRRLVVGYHHSSEDQNTDPELLAKVAEQVDAHVFLSKFAQGQFVQTCANLVPHRVLKTFVIQNGVNLSQFRPDEEGRSRLRREHGLAAQDRAILFAGRIIERKGVDRLLQAIELLSDDVASRLHLVLAGGTDFFKTDSTPYSRKVREMATKLSARVRVHWAGYVPHRKVHELYQMCDILAFPSVQPEACPLGLMEGLATGLPPVASALGGISEIVEHGKTGFLVAPPGELKAMADYLTLLMRDGPLVDRMRTAAIAHARQHFSAERMAADFGRMIGAVSEKRYSALPA